jgi:hypothetical protein
MRCSVAFASVAESVAFDVAMVCAMPSILQ